MQSRKGFADILVIAAVVVFLGIGGYLYWQGQNTEDVDNGVDESTPTGEVTVEPTNIPVTPIEALPTPENIEAWSDSSYGETETWSFKYPPTWIETKNDVTKGYSYSPSQLVANEFSLTFNVKLGPEAPEEAVERINRTGKILRKETFKIGEKFAEWYVIDNGQLMTQVYIRGIDFGGFGENTQCYEDGVLVVTVSQAVNGKNYVMKDVPFEQDIKQLLTTLEFSSCY